jgi:amino acid permease
MMPASFFARLLPAALSMAVTAFSIAMVAAQEYGQYSYWLALASGLNVVFFHGTRHLVTFGAVLDMPPDIVTRGWQVGICLTVAAIALGVLVGALAPVVGAGMLLLVAGQSVFERELAYCRASLLRWRYLAVACVRPLISLGMLALIHETTNGRPPATAIWTGLAASPMLAVLPFFRQVWRRCYTRSSVSACALRSLASTAVVLVAPAGFLFLANAVARITLARRMSPTDFGQLSAISDIALSAGWVVTSAATWGFVAGTLRREGNDRVEYIHKHIRRVTWIGVVACAALLMTPASGPWPVSIDVISPATLFVANLLGAMTTCIVLPALIIAGDLRRAWALAVAGTLSIPVWGLALPAEDALDIASAARALLLSHAAVLIAALIISGYRSPCRRRLACEGP